MVDNGPNTRRYVAGMRGMKSEVYEGGIRSPLLMHWPAGLRAGSTSDRIAAHIDIMPTILEACQVSLPRELNIDGRSLLPLLKDQPVEWTDRNIVIQTHRGDRPVLFHHFALLNQRWKLLHASGFGRETFEGEPRFKLYDMLNDPLEMQDVAMEKPEIVEELKRAYEEWFMDVSQTRPDNYAPPRIHIGTPHENPIVLTRQDWRSKDPWGGKNSRGYWMLHAPEPGRYDILVRFRDQVGPGEAVLEAGGRTIKYFIAEVASEVTFQEVDLDAGDLNLEVRFESSGEIRGPWQVELLRK
jgi:hypothetical protein